MSEYPEHDKLAAVMEQSQAIGEFLDSGKYVLAEHVVDETGTSRLYPVSRSINDILADYFGIDLKRLEAEKRDMLDRIRRSMDGAS